MSVRFSQQALRDLVDIQRYVACDRPMAAIRLGQRLVLACDSLNEFPHRARMGIIPGTRELTVVRPYVIAYRVLPDGDVGIIGIWHGARNRGG